MKNIETSFLKDKYWGKEEFRSAVDNSTKRSKRQTEAKGETFKTPKKPTDKIPYYLERIERIAGKDTGAGEEKRRRLLEKFVYPEYIIKPKNVSDDYIKGVLLGNFAEQRGYERGDLKNEEIKQQILIQFKTATSQDFDTYQIPNDERKRVADMVVADQTSRLNAWYDYLTGPDAGHAPAAFRYWAFAELLKLGTYDEDRKVFNKRDDATVASFPELNQQALALVFDEVERKRAGEPSTITVTDEAQQAEFRERLKSVKFGDLYAFALEHVNSLRLPTERLIITKGEWKHFPKDTPPNELTPALGGFNTQWCIAGEGYARDYLSKSDIWIYFSEDAEGKNSIPRACIVDSKEHGITEVRGIMSSTNAKQHLDSYITPTVDAKLKELPGGEKWQNTMADMKTLARIHLKHLQRQPLNKEDLTFLYEIDHPIQLSGYEQDPRMEELRQARNSDEDFDFVFPLSALIKEKMKAGQSCAKEELSWLYEVDENLALGTFDRSAAIGRLRKARAGEIERDMLAVFECTEDQIAHVPREINRQTKVYVGKLEPGIFDLIQQYGIEHVYTTFPKGKIRREQDEIGGKTAERLKKEMRRRGNNISDYALAMMKHRDFTTQKQKESIDLIHLTVRDLGFPNGATTAEIIGAEDDVDVNGNPAPFTKGVITELGLELCPAEVGPHFRLKYKDQPMNEWMAVGMKPISGPGGAPCVFGLVRDDRGRWLEYSWAEPEYRWSPESEFLFRLRKSET